MRTTLRAAAASVVLLAALSVSGCAPDPVTPDTPAPTSTPLFASDEEALAAAEEAYAAYVALGDQIYEEGGRESERLSAVATGAQLETDIAGMNEIAELGYRSVGKTAFDGIRLQSHNPDTPDGKAVVVVYLCQDIGGVDVFDSSGKSVILPTRPDRTQFEVTFDKATPSAERTILVSNRTPWSDLPC